MKFISKKADLLFQTNERDVVPYVADRGEEGKTLKALLAFCIFDIICKILSNTL